MDTQQSLLLKKYIDLLMRWKILLTICFLLSLPVGLIVYLQVPKVYQATSLLSYQQQKVNPNKMSPDVEARIRDIVSTLTQIVTSRTNLENVITNLNLYPDLIEQLPMEDVVDLMRKKITIEPSRQGDTFRITFEGGDPSKVVKVTNALAAKFIEENLKYREERASETSSYTSDELEMAKITLDSKEAAMRDYKLKYYNEMPEQRISNVSRLIALQEQYQEQQRNILELEQTMVMIQDQIANRKKLLAADASLAGGDVGSSGQQEVVVGSAAQRLAMQKARLESLQMKYTQNHPEVKRVQRQIEKLAEEVAAQPVGVEQEDVSLSEGSSVESGLIDKVLLQLEVQRKNVSLNIKTIKAEKEKLKAAIEQYEHYVAAAPVREAEWSALTREYGELKRHYDYLVSQNLQAKSMLNLERRQKGSQFKIEDPARFPEKPVQPNFLQIMGLAVFGGLAAGVGCVLCINFLDASFREPDEVETFLGIPVVCTIGYIETVQEEAQRKRKNTITMGATVLAVVLIIALFLYAYHAGKITV